MHVAITTENRESLNSINIIRCCIFFVNVSMYPVGRYLRPTTSRRNPVVLLVAQSSSCIFLRKRAVIKKANVRKRVVAVKNGRDDSRFSETYGIPGNFGKALPIPLGTYQCRLYTRVPHVLAARQQVFRKSRLSNPEYYLFPYQ